VSKYTPGPWRCPYCRQRHLRRRELERMESLSATERPAACVAYGGAKPAECICPDDGVDEDCKATERRALLARVDGGGR